MMKRHILAVLLGLFALLSLVPSAPAQNATVSGDLSTIFHDQLQGDAFVRVRLRNYSGCVPRVSGGGAIIAETTKEVSPDNTGHFSTTLVRNDFVDVCGVTNRTFYSVEYWNNGVAKSSANYQCLSATCDLNTLATFNPQPPPTKILNAVLTNPDGNQIVTQPAGTTLSVNNFAITGICTGCGATLPGVKVVDGTTFTTIAGAATAAGSTGIVLIPPTYAGTDTDLNTNQRQRVDWRGFPNRQRGYINMLTDCGLKGDGVTDDSAAANACLAAYPGTRFYFPPTNFGNNPSYFFAASLTPIGNTTVITGGANGFLNDINKAGSTVLKFAAGITGIDIQSCGCTVEYISLLGSEGTQNMVNPVLLNFPSGANLPLFTRNISSIQRTSNVLTVTISKAGTQEGLTQQVGSTVKIAGVVGDTTMNGLCVVASLSGNSAFGGNPVTFTCPQNGADAGPFGAVGTISLPTTGPSTADGIHVCNNFVFILHVTIQSFGRHGINADSLPGHGCNSPFSDDLVVRDSSIIGNQGEGFVCDGTDCNAGLLESNAFYYNLLWAVEDQSALGNSYQSNQISNNGVQWTGVATPATKAISSISRTLTSNSSTVSVVLSVADPFAKLGSCMVIAGVTDTSFNTPANQCFFITSFTDSTHYSYIQPGAPANASSSGGTSRMSTYREAYLSAGVDTGALKVGTQAAASSPSLYATYAEGGQYCKFGASTINVGGVGAQCGNAPSATSSSDFLGQYIATACPGLGGTLCIGAPVLFSYAHDFGGGISFRSGFTTDATFGFNFLKFNSTSAWGLVVDPAGTAGGSGSFHISSQGFGQTRLIFFGKDTNSGHTYLSAEGSGGKVIFGRNYAGTNAGTGGIEVDSGGASPATVATIDGTGLGTFNGGVIGPFFKSNTANPASAGAIRLAKTDAVNFRNNANGADITALSLNGSDQVVLPTTVTTTQSQGDNSTKLATDQYVDRIGPGGSGAAITFWTPNGTVSGNTTVGTINVVREAHFFLTNTVAFNKIGITNISADASNNYSFGVFSLDGTVRYAHTTEQAMVGTGTFRALAVVEGTVTIPPGDYLFTWTGASLTASFNTLSSGAATRLAPASSSTTTTLGAMPAAPINVPALSPNQAAVGIPSFILYQ